MQSLNVMTMITNIFRAAALATIVTIAGMPAVSQAAVGYDTNPVHVKYDTSIAPIAGFGYPWTGTLQLTINPDGIINGYYRAAGNGSFIPVTGGRDGKNVWLDIGQSGRLHVTGTLHEGTIAGTAFDQRNLAQYKFNASIA